MTASRISTAAQAAYQAKLLASMTIPDAAAQAHPTHADVKAHPAYFISGPGRDIASSTQCAHGYYLTDSCPGCDYDDDQAAPDPDLCAHGYSLYLAAAACPNCRRNGVTPVAAQ
jgi:hypothetical protein